MTEWFAQQLRAPPQVGDEALELPLARFIVALPQHRRWMDRDDHLRVAIVQHLAAHRGDRHRTPEHAAYGGRAERHHHARPDDAALEIEPPAAGVDLAGVRPFVQPALAARLELEMLDRIGDEHLL